jgi:hypothetical protein
LAEYPDFYGGVPTAFRHDLSNQTVRKRIWGRMMNHSLTKATATISITAVLGIASNLPAFSEAPTAEVAKRCLHYSYVAYPYKRPGAVQMSGDRQAYFKDCLSKKGDVPAPTPPSKP